MTTRDLRPDQREHFAELSGRFIADGLPQEEADRRALAFLRAEILAPVSLEEIRTAKFSRTWFLDGLFTFGLSIIAAKKANWKSLLALQAAYGIAAGIPFLGKSVPQAVKVLYLALELDKIAMSERAQRLGPAPEGLDILFTFSRGPEAIADLDALLTARDYKVIFVDMAAAILPGGTDGNQYDQVTGFLLQLRRLAQKRQACIVLLLHSPKSEKTDFADAVLGSVGFGGQADSIIFIDRKRGENVARVLCTGNHGSDSVFKIRMDKTLRLSLFDDGGHESFLPPEADAVLRALQQFPDGTSPAKLAASMGKIGEKAAESVRVALYRLVDKGFAHKTGRGVYCAFKTNQLEINEGGDNESDPF
jgi:hypothetical protein